MSDWTQFWELHMACFFFLQKKEQLTQKYYFEITIWEFWEIILFLIVYC